jgi:hypothetical protein
MTLDADRGGDDLPRSVRGDHGADGGHDEHEEHDQDGITPSLPEAAAAVHRHE